MITKNKKALSQTVLLGIVSGMRATFAAGIASHFLNKKPSEELKNSKLGFIQSNTAAAVTKGLMALELTGDKLPSSPDRIVAPQVGARIAAGSFAGAVIFKSNGQRVLPGIVLGGLTALAATFGTYYLRKAIAEKLLKEPYPGIAEDLIGLGTGVAAMKSL